MHELVGPDAVPTRAAIYDSMNAALAQLHGVEPAAVGLSDFGVPGNYFERQFGRWTKQYAASEVDRNENIHRLIDWLAARMPPDDGQVALVHGDYRLDNMVFARDSAAILGILDWELSTLGHPLADLAYQCMQWRLPHHGGFRGLGGIDRAAIGIPSEEEYVAAYCRRRGIGPIDNWPFYLAFSFFRLAAILQGVYKRSLDGNASNPGKGAILWRGGSPNGRTGAQDHLAELKTATQLLAYSVSTHLLKEVAAMPHKPRAAALAAKRTMALAIAALAFTFIVAFSIRAFAQDAVPQSDAMATQQVINDQIAAFKAGDGERAYSHAAPSIKQVFTTVDRFMGMVQTGYMPLYNPDSFVFGRNAFISGQVHQEVIVTDPQGKQWQAVYTLVRQPDGSWKINGVKLNPYTGANA